MQWIAVSLMTTVSAMWCYHIVLTYMYNIQHNSYFRWYNTLQVMMQEVLEYIILLDRQQYLIEKGHQCQLMSVFDDKISPRSVAIVAYKPWINLFFSFYTFINFENMFLNSLTIRKNLLIIFFLSGAITSKSRQYISLL